MSGAESLAVLGLACNVLQLIQTSQHVISRARNIINSGTPDPHLSSVGEDLTKLTATVAQRIRASAKYPTSQDDDLQAVARKCQDASIQLQTELRKLSGDPGQTKKGLFRVSLLYSAKMATSGRRIKDLEARMSNYQHLLETRILVRISEQQDLTMIQNDKHFDALDRTLQEFIKRLATGIVTLSGLILDESESVKKHVTEDGAKTRDEIKTHLASLATQHATKEEVKNFLESLWWDMMNDRRNRILDEHDGTFKWVFNIEEPEYDSESEDKSEGGSEHDSEGESGDDNDGDNDSDDKDCESVSRKCSLSDTSSSTQQQEKHWDDFPTWLAAPDDKIYWISGKPGSGKSTLMKFIIGHVRLEDCADLISQDAVLLSHFFWIAGQAEQRTLKGCVSSLLHQLITLMPTLYDDIKEKYPHTLRKRVLSDWSDNEVTAVLMFACSRSLSPIYVFLDALDESTSESVGEHQVVSLVESVSKISQAKLCVSSRPEPVWRTALGECKQLRMQDLTLKDMRRYCSSQLRRIVPSGDLRSYKYELCNKADGVFLWLALAVTSLRRAAENGDSPEIIEARLNQLPSGLYQLYKDMWERLNDDREVYRKRAAAHLSLAVTWILEHSRIVFFPRVDLELQHFVYAQDPALADQHISLHSEPAGDDAVDQRSKKIKRELKTQCAGLIEVSVDGKVTFVHRSAVEFLTGTAEGQTVMGDYGSITREECANSLAMADAAVVVRLLTIAFPLVRRLWHLRIRMLHNCLRINKLNQITFVGADTIRPKLRTAYTNVWDKLMNDIALGASIHGNDFQDHPLYDPLGASVWAGDADHLETFLGEHNGKRVLSQTYLLYILEALCKAGGPPDPRRYADNLRAFDLLLNYGMNMSIPSVSLTTMTSETTRQCVSVRRTACSILVTALWSCVPWVSSSLIQRGLDHGADPRQKVLLGLGSYYGNSNNEWVLTPFSSRYDSGFLKHHIKPSRPWSLVLEMDMDYAQILLLHWQSVNICRSLDRSKLRIFKIQTKIEPQNESSSPGGSNAEHPRRQCIWSVSHEHECRILDCLAGPFIVFKTLREPESHSVEIPGLSSLLEQAAIYGSTEISESDFFDELVASGHFVRRHMVSDLPPLPPDPFTGEPLKGDMITVIEEDSTSLEGAEATCIS